MGRWTRLRFLFGKNILGGNSPSGEGGLTAPATDKPDTNIHEKGSAG